MEWKIGEIRQVNGEWYQCVERDSCGECSLYTTECRGGSKSDLADEVFGQCSNMGRSDNKNVIFKKLEKVGEPMEFARGLYLQRYRLAYSTAFYEGDTRLFFNAPTKTFVYIEIKQNKEDVKEDTEEKKLNLKPFDIQKAREGKPVCTRDGRKARIICFDRVTNSTNEYTGHLIVLVTNPNGDEQSFYYTEKGNLAGEDEYDNHKWDLMMLPEKKGGWVNIYRDIDDNTPYTENDNIYSSRYKAKESAKMINMKTYIDTIKISWEE